MKNNISIISFCTDHCNNFCKYCSNFGCYYKENFYDLNKYLDFFQILIDKDIHFFEIAVTGGEPMLHSDITNYIVNLRKIVGKDRIRLSTNGFWIKNKNYLNYNKIYENVDGILFTTYKNIFKDTINNIDVIEFKNYIINNYSHIYFRLENRETMFPWEFTNNKIKRNFPCYLYNTCLGIDIYTNRIHRCITIAKILDLVNRNKNKIDISNLNYQTFLNNIELEDSLEVNNNLTKDKFEEWININQDNIECCKYCTYGEYRNLNKYFYEFDKLLPNNYNLKNLKFGKKWEKINNTEE
jgi:organic radical activating enzyme